jgi:hypothetical protein
MKFLLILTWIVGQPSYDGGAGVHTVQIGFSEMARCERAAASMRGEWSARLADNTRPKVYLVAKCIEAY